MHQQSCGMGQAVQAVKQQLGHGLHQHRHIQALPICAGQPLHQQTSRLTQAGQPLHQQLRPPSIWSMASLSTTLHRRAAKTGHGGVGCLLSAIAAAWGHDECISIVHSETGRRDQTQQTRLCCPHTGTRSSPASCSSQQHQPPWGFGCLQRIDTWPQRFMGSRSCTASHVWMRCPVEL